MTETEEPTNPKILARIREAALWIRDSSLGTLGFIIVAGVAFAGWTVSFIGLHTFATQHMSLTWTEAWLVPATYDGAPAGLTLIVMRAASHGRSAWVWRMLIVAFTALSCLINYVHLTDPSGRIVAALMPLAAVVVFEALISEARKAAERRAGITLRPRLHPLRLVFDWTGTLGLIRTYILELPVPGGMAMASEPKHIICAGPTGTLFLRRPAPARILEPAGPIGERVRDINSLLSGAHAPIVYFVSNGERIKIGTSTNLRRRIRQFCLRVEDIALALHGDKDYEGQLHYRFASHRIGDTEWFNLAGDLARFVATGGGAAGASASTNPVASEPPVGAPSVDSSTPPVGDKGTARHRQALPSPGDSEDLTLPTAPRQPAPRAAARKAPATGRRSLGEWVELAGPIFHAEFQRLRRQPTGDEFATAIKKARLGTVSASTAKNIRAEILDRADVPALDGGNL